MMRMHSNSGAYGFKCRKIDFSGIYRMVWVVDYYYADSRLRFPRPFSRDTDQRGAERFCKKHNINLAD